MRATISNMTIVSGSQQYNFSSSIPLGESVSISIEAQNLGIPTAMGIGWTVSKPDGNVVQQYQIPMTDFMIRTNGKHYLSGPLLVLDKEGQWNIQITLYAGDKNNPVVADSYMGPLGSVVTAPSQVRPAMPKPVGIPHPEEPMYTSLTLTNIDVNAIITKWLTDWEVPVQYWDFWKTATDMQVYEIYPPSLLAMGLKQDTPAGTWESGGKRHLAIKPQWLNPGVIAHEQAHNSYALLTPAQKAAFSTIHATLKNTDSTIRLLYSKNPYGLTNDVEGHAEVYRYIGQWMPAQLTIFYPRLF